MSLRIGGISNPPLNRCADAAFRQGAGLHHRILKGGRFQLHIAEGDSAQWLDGLGVCTAHAWSEAGWLANIYVVRFLIPADEVAAKTGLSGRRLRRREMTVKGFSQFFQSADL